jgi:hypothetical protein
MLFLGLDYGRNCISLKPFCEDNRYSSFLKKMCRRTCLCSWLFANKVYPNLIKKTYMNKITLLFRLIPLLTTVFAPGQFGKSGALTPKIDKKWPSRFIIYINWTIVAWNLVIRYGERLCNLTIFPCYHISLCRCPSWDRMLFARSWI